MPYDRVSRPDVVALGAFRVGAVIGDVHGSALSSSSHASTWLKAPNPGAAAKPDYRSIAMVSTDERVGLWLRPRPETLRR